MTEISQNLSITILVTGASGFIGRQLIETLSQSASEYKIIALVRDSNQFESSFDVIEGNINLIDDRLKKILHKVDVVVHAAGVSKTPFLMGRTKKHEIFHTNCNATIALANSAIEAGVSKFIFLSSAKVFGEAEINNQPFKILDKPKPATFYAHTKRQAEKKLSALSKTTSMTIHIIRPPLVIGKPGNMKKGLLDKILSLGIPIPIAGFNENLRSYVKVETLCEGIQSLILDNSKKSTIRIFKEKKDISTSAIFELIANKSGYNLRSFRFPPIVIKICCRLLFLKKLEQSLLENLRIKYDNSNELI